jgi:hypothetical protein
MRNMVCDLLMWQSWSSLYGMRNMVCHLLMWQSSSMWEWLWRFKIGPKWGALKSWLNSWRADFHSFQHVLYFRLLSKNINLNDREI